MTDTADLARLEARLAALEAEKAVLATLYQYGHSIDYGLRSNWLDCFAEDGTFELKYTQPPSARVADRGYGERTAEGYRFAGRAALTDFIEHHTHAPNAWHKHFLVEPRITIGADGRTATAASYFARLDDRNGERIILAFGRYLDELTLHDDGKWRFTRRTAEIETAL